VADNLEAMAILVKLYDAFPRNNLETHQAEALQAAGDYLKRSMGAKVVEALILYLAWPLISQL